MSDLEKYTGLVLDLQYLYDDIENHYIKSVLNQVDIKASERMSLSLPLIKKDSLELVQTLNSIKVSQSKKPFGAFQNKRPSSPFRPSETKKKLSPIKESPTPTIVKPSSPVKEINWNDNCEGYWASGIDPAKDTYKGRYPWPKPFTGLWPERDQFIKRLEILERIARDEAGGADGKGLWRMRYRGDAPSRLEPRVSAGADSFFDYDYKMCWTSGLLPHYIKKHNIKPSQKFIDYVMSRRLTQ